MSIRAVNIRTDLDPIADLIEICFANRMDSDGRAAVQDMRSLAKLGGGLVVVQRLDQMLKGLVQGFVWVEDGCVVGNVSIYPAGYEHTWVIANVGVLPAFRGRGIAYQLCQAALERIVAWRGTAAILQVDHDNTTAQRVYQRLGFWAERTFTRWHYSSANRAPQKLATMPYITYKNLGEWKSIYTLVETVRPPARGGLGWLRPVRVAAFRPSFFKMFYNLFLPSSLTYWIVRGEKPGELDALVMAKTSFLSPSLYFDLLVHPRQQGRLEEAMVNFTLRRAADDLRGATTEHPADDDAANQVFEDYNFQIKRTLLHMRWEK